MDPQKHSRNSISVYVDFTKKIATVYQAEAEDFALFFICVRTLQCQERIELMTAVSSHTVNFLRPFSQMPGTDIYLGVFNSLTAVNRHGMPTSITS